MPQVVRSSTRKAFCVIKGGCKGGQSKGLDKACQGGMMQAASTDNLCDSVVVDQEVAKPGAINRTIFFGRRGAVMSLTSLWKRNSIEVCSV